MMKPLVSILLPAFNAERWLSDTLCSAVAQTWQPKEIIVVDDGSIDRTLAIARRFESESVRVLTQKNRGAAAARNNAFSHCRGDYIQWLDADDLLAPDKVSSQLQALGDGCGGRTLISSSWGYFLYRPDQARFVPTPLWCDLSPVEWLIRKMGQNLHMQTATWLVSRELTEAAGPWNTELSVDDDGEYFCRVLLASQGVRFVPESRVYYRMSGGGSLSYIGNSAHKKEAQWHSMEFHIRYLRSLEDSERVRRACIQYLQNWLLVFYPETPDVVRRARELARSLGGDLVEPRLSWKYAWMTRLCGWNAAKRAQLLLPRIRWSVLRAWDKALFALENRVNTPGEMAGSKIAVRL
jgi:glycosyltransferase involved in cell wall biosynthesis